MKELKPIQPEQKFIYNLRSANPACHLLAVKWAAAHLTTIDKCIRLMMAHSNLNMIDCALALRSQREKLIRENAAYADAQEILDGISLAKKAK